MDIAFDDGVADLLTRACRDAVHMLEGQRGRRHTATAGALREFRGVFSDAFRENVQTEQAARTSLVGILEGLAIQVEAVKRAAAVERGRLAKVAAWELEHTMAYRSNGGLLVEEGPRPDTAPGDQPRIYVPSARVGYRSWPGGGTAGSSSADPDNLEAAVSVFRSQYNDVHGVTDRTVSAVGAFLDNCSWVFTDADAVRSGLRRFVTDNHDDSTKLAAIAAAFRAAGGAGDIGAVTLSNTLLVAAEAPATLTGPALLAFLSTATATDLKALPGVKGWQQTLQALDPGKIATWWAGLSPKVVWAADGSMQYSRVQDLLLTDLPAVFGNLNGIPYTARGRANLIWLDQQLTDANTQLAEQQQVLQGAAGTDTTTPLTRIGLLQERTRTLQNIRTSIGDAIPGAPRFLVGLTADNPPLAQISIGNLDKATDVTYAIPGMNTSTGDASGWVNPSQNLFNEQRRVAKDPAGSTRFAVVAWIGYKTPPIPVISGQPDVGVIRGDYARAGADRLSNDLAGFVSTRPNATLNLVAHSYGTTTATDALHDHDFGVNTLTLLASAGIEPDVGGVSGIHAQQVFAAQANDAGAPLPGDNWAWVGRLGSFRDNPIDPGFGATVFGADGDPGRPDLHPTTMHDAMAGTPGDGYGYLDKDTESLYNTALSTTGLSQGLTGDQTHYSLPVQTIDPGPFPQKDNVF